MIKIFIFIILLLIKYQQTPQDIPHKKQDLPHKKKLQDLPHKKHDFSHKKMLQESPSPPNKWSYILDNFMPNFYIPMFIKDYNRPCQFSKVISHIEIH